MSQLVAGVTAKLQDLLPGEIGVRWPTATISTLAMAADAAAKEKTGQWFVSQEISLVDDTDGYQVDPKFIAITSVEFSPDGTNYDGHLTAVTMEDLDRFSYKWRNDTGSRPEYYYLASAPGTQNRDATDGGSMIYIYRAPGTTTSETIRINGIGLGATTDDVPDEIQDLVHVPYVLSLLYAHEDPGLAAEYWRDYLRGCASARRRFIQPTAETPARHVGTSLRRI